MNGRCRLILSAAMCVLPGCLGSGSGSCGLNLGGTPVPECSGQNTAPACTGYSWIVAAAHCQDSFLRDFGCAGLTDLVLDVNASPPQARVRVGEAAVIELLPINSEPPGGCLFNSGQFSFMSSNPTVASIEKTNINTLVIVRAQAPGDADVFADGVSTPTGPIQARLAYCSDRRQGAACVPINLVLRVVR
jgi:hypothetical protein